MAKWGISIARYSPKVNAVRERTVYLASGYRDGVARYRELANKGLPIYYWYSDPHQVHIFSTTFAYDGEYRKVRN